MRRTSFLMVALWAGLGSVAHAAPAGECNISTNPLRFGRYTAADATGAESTFPVTLNCKNVASVALGLGPSEGTGSVNQRAMARTSKGELLAYNIYLDPGHNLVWGTSGSGQALIVATDAAKQTTVIGYGLIPSGQDAPVGHYRDTLTVYVEP